MLPTIGLKLERAIGDRLFDALDVDKSGALQYGEIHQLLRRAYYDLSQKQAGIGAASDSSRAEGTANPPASMTRRNTM